MRTKKKRKRKVTAHSCRPARSASDWQSTQQPIVSRKTYTLDRASSTTALASCGSHLHAYLSCARVSHARAISFSAYLAPPPAYSSRVFASCARARPAPLRCAPLRTPFTQGSGHGWPAPVSTAARVCESRKDQCSSALSSDNRGVRVARCGISDGGWVGVAVLWHSDRTRLLG